MRKSLGFGNLQRVILGMTVLALCAAGCQMRARARESLSRGNHQQAGCSRRESVRHGGSVRKNSRAKFISPLIPTIRTIKLSPTSIRRPRTRRAKWNSPRIFFILRPKDPSRGNGSIIFDIPNRGHKKGALSTFNRAKGSNDPTTEDEFGDGMLMRLGYTVVSPGWEFDIPKEPDLVLLTAPVATDNGKPITGWLPVNPWFIPNKKVGLFTIMLQGSLPLPILHWTQRVPNIV